VVVEVTLYALDRIERLPSGSDRLDTQRQETDKNEV
jgi:hypothetical protein